MRAMLRDWSRLRRLLLGSRRPVVFSYASRARAVSPVARAGHRRGRGGGRTVGLRGHSIDIRGRPDCPST
eukprot:10158553-Alexandrium_andersonii.AAC.1